MNECFFIGKIISNINFEFIYKSKNIAITNFRMKLLDNNEIDVKAYNELADYCYSKLEINDIIFINGKIETRGIINIKKIKKEIIKKVLTFIEK